MFRNSWIGCHRFLCAQLEFVLLLNYKHAPRIVRASDIHSVRLSESAGKTGCISILGKGSPRAERVPKPHSKKRPDDQQTGFSWAQSQPRSPAKVKLVLGKAQLVGKDFALTSVLPATVADPQRSRRGHSNRAVLPIGRKVPVREPSGKTKWFGALMMTEWYSSKVS
jgi:hypothetical protein